MKIKKFSTEDYEKICFILNKKPVNNKILKGFFINRLEKNELLDTNFYFTEVDYLIIASNPLFSNFILNELKKREISNVFVHNIYIEDNFDYKSINQNFDILDNLNEKDNVIFTNEKDIILSYSNRKLNDSFMFSNFHHPYLKIEKMFSKEYVDVWSKFENKVKNKELWSNKNFKKENKHYESFVFAKKVIVQNANNPYLDKSIFSDPNCLTFSDENISEIKTLLEKL